MHQEMQELGDVRFVINVGDSFYPVGVQDKSDPQWTSKWRSVYSAELRSVPWYSVYGNHDMMNDKGTCAGDENNSAQINYNEQDLDFFYMPGFSYFKEFPDLDMEVVALDMNELWVNQTCPWSGCEAECRARSYDRAYNSVKLFYERMNKSDTSKMVVFSHYPTDYLWPLPTMLGNLSNGTRPNGSPRQVAYFGGHRHNVDQKSTTSIAPGGTSWLVGGGGGWGCDGDEQGFVVAEILSDGSMITRPVLVETCDCCPCNWWR